MSSLPQKVKGFPFEITPPRGQYSCPSSLYSESDEYFTTPDVFGAEATKGGPVFPGGVCHVFTGKEVLPGEEAYSIPFSAQGCEGLTEEALSVMAEGLAARLIGIAESFTDPAQIAGLRSLRDYHRRKSVDVSYGSGSGGEGQGDGEGQFDEWLPANPSLEDLIQFEAETRGEDAPEGVGADLPPEALEALKAFQGQLSEEDSCSEADEHEGVPLSVLTPEVQSEAVHMASGAEQMLSGVIRLSGEGIEKLSRGDRIEPGEFIEALSKARGSAERLGSQAAREAIETVVQARGGVMYTSGGPARECLERRCTDPLPEHFPSELAKYVNADSDGDLYASFAIPVELPSGMSVYVWVIWRFPQVDLPLVMAVHPRYAYGLPTIEHLGSDPRPAVRAQLVAAEKLVEALKPRALSSGQRQSLQEDGMVRLDVEGGYQLFENGATAGIDRGKIEGPPEETMWKIARRQMENSMAGRRTRRRERALELARRADNIYRRTGDSVWQDVRSAYLELAKEYGRGCEKAIIAFKYDTGDALEDVGPPLRLEASRFGLSPEDGVDPVLGRLDAIDCICPGGGASYHHRTQALGQPRGFEDALGSAERGELFEHLHEPGERLLPASGERGPLEGDRTYPPTSLGSALGLGSQLGSGNRRMLQRALQVGGPSLQSVYERLRTIDGDGTGFEPFIRALAKLEGREPSLSAAQEEALESEVSLLSSALEGRRAAWRGYAKENAGPGGQLSPDVESGAFSRAVDLQLRLLGRSASLRALRLACLKELKRLAAGYRQRRERGYTGQRQPSSAGVEALAASRLGEVFPVGTAFFSGAPETSEATCIAYLSPRDPSRQIPGPKGPQQEMAVAGFEGSTVLLESEGGGVEVILEVTSETQEEWQDLRRRYGRDLAGMRCLLVKIRDARARLIFKP